jgi:hypothetical protein
MRSNAGTHGSRAEYGNFLDSFQQGLLRTTGCMDCTPGNGSAVLHWKLERSGAAQWRRMTARGGMQEKGENLQIQRRRSGQSMQPRGDCSVGLIFKWKTELGGVNSPKKRGGARRECGVRMATARALFN